MNSAWSGGCLLWGGCLVQGCLFPGGAWSGGCLLLGWGRVSGGLSVPRGCLVLGVPAPWECLVRGVPGLGGAWSGRGGIPACTEADPPVNRMTDRLGDLFALKKYQRKSIILGSNIQTCPQKDTHFKMFLLC